MLPSAHPRYVCLQILKDGPVFSTGMTYHETFSVLGWHTTVRSSKEFEQQNSVSDQIQWWHCQKCTCHHITQYHAILATSKRSWQTHNHFPLFSDFSIPQHDSPSNLAESRVLGLGRPETSSCIRLHPFRVRGRPHCGCCWIRRFLLILWQCPGKRGLGQITW